MKKPPKTIRGDNTIAINPTCHEKYIHIELATINPIRDSNPIAYVSEVKPLRSDMSSWITFPKIPGALFLSSNHPICLYRIASKSSNLI